MCAHAEHPRVSVIIPTYNRCAVLADCVDSVLRSDYRSFEIIVVDNASTDETETVFRERSRADARVRHIRLTENRMAAGGRNAGALQARGAYLLFLDNDNLVEPEMMGLLVRAFDAHPDAGLIGPLSIQADTGTIWTLGSDYDLRTSRPINLQEGKRPETGSMRALHPTRYVPNAMMVPRSVFLQTGGFDPFYMAMYEEADFGFRITERGRNAYICPAARTLHLGAAGAGQALPLRRLGIETPQRAYFFARNRSVFMRRFAPWHGQLVFFLAFVHVFTLAYCAIAVRHRRPDIALSYFRGAFRGLWHAAFGMPPRPRPAAPASR